MRISNDPREFLRQLVLDIEREKGAHVVAKLAELLDAGYDGFLLDIANEITEKHFPETFCTPISKEENLRMAAHIQDSYPP